MVTDDERRRVAAALRGAGGPSLVKLMAILGVGGEDAFPRLADLIDPDCDREALLALADQLSGAVEPYQWEVGEQSYFKSIIAERIREACGEVGE